MKSFLIKLKKFVMKNKLLSILILLILLIVILGLIGIKILVFPSYSVSKYGHRLDGIESVKIDDSRFDEIKNSFEAIDGISIKSIRLSGKIVNIILDVQNGKGIDSHKIKSDSSKLLEKFSEEELKYYDFQIFVSGNDDVSTMIGYKSTNSEKLNWNYEGEK